METLAAWLGGLLVAARPAFILLCWGASFAMNEGRQASYADGKPIVMSTIGNFIFLRLSEIDWRGIGAGLMGIRRHFRAALGDLRRKLVDDWLGFVSWLSEPRFGKREPTHAEQTMALVKEAKAADIPLDERAALLAANIEGLQAQARVLARIPHAERTREQSNEYHHINAFLDDHFSVNQRGMAYQPPRFAALGALTGGLGLKAALATGVAALAFLGLWRLEVAHSDKLEASLDASKAWIADAKVKEKGWVDYSVAMSARVTGTASRFNDELNAARTAELKAKQTAAAERKRRLDEQAKTIAGGGDVPLADILRSLPALGDDGGSASNAADTSQR